MIQQVRHHDPCQAGRDDVQEDVDRDEPEDRQVEYARCKPEPHDAQDFVLRRPDQAHREQAEDDPRCTQHAHRLCTVHQELHSGALADAETEIDQHEGPPAQLPLDDHPEGPEENHVADQVPPTRVHEDVRKPLERVYALAQDQGPILVAPGGKHQERQHVEHHQRDRGDRPVVERSITAPRDDHANRPRASANDDKRKDSPRRSRRTGRRRRRPHLIQPAAY